MLGRILAAGLGLVAACYSPPQPDCGFSCLRLGDCPSGYFCAPDGICHRDGTPPELQCAVDARIDAPRPIDAPPPDADITAPALLASMPANGDTDVARTVAVRVQFTEPVFNVSGTTFTASSSSVAIPGAVATIDPYNYTFTPSQMLPASAPIEIQLSAAIHDTVGNYLVATSFSFETAP